MTTIDTKFISEGRRAFSRSRSLAIVETLVENNDSRYTFFEMTEPGYEGTYDDIEIDGVDWKFGRMSEPMPRKQLENLVELFDGLQANYFLTRNGEKGVYAERL